MFDSDDDLLLAVAFATPKTIEEIKSERCERCPTCGRIFIPPPKEPRYMALLRSFFVKEQS